MVTGTALLPGLAIALAINIGLLLLGAAYMVITDAWYRAAPRRAQWRHERHNRPTVRITLHAPIRITKSR